MSRQFLCKIVFACSVARLIPYVMVAQTNTQYPGDNAVYQTSTGTITYTHSFVDGNHLGASDICGAINAGLLQLVSSTYTQYNGKGVIDVRSVPVGSSNACTATDSNPWGGTPPAGVSGWPYATILLPAGTIYFNATWTLPEGTRLVGEGPNLTVLEALSSFQGTDMIDMGNSALCGTDCNGIVLEHLGLNAGSQNVNGIVNQYSQELSYVNDVSITGILSGYIGLSIGNTSNGQYADNSGPYSSIYFSGSGTCVSILDTFGTRGIHGLNCAGSSATGPAIMLDGTNNSIENVTISGYTGDGIEIGSRALAQSNVLLNISGSSSLTNVIHVCGTGNSSSSCKTSYVSDLTIMGATSAANYTIQDDVTNTPLPFSTDEFVGLYVLGEAAPSTGTVGNSRFTTSPSVPTWFAGNTQPSGPCTGNGSMYSVTGKITSGATTTLWGCVGSTWSAKLSGTTY